MPTEEVIENIEKQQRAVSSMVKRASEKVDTKSLKVLSVKEETEENIARKAKLELARKVTDEAFSMFEDGDMNLEETIKDINTSLKAIEGGDQKSEEGLGV